MDLTGGGFQKERWGWRLARLWAGDSASGPCRTDPAPGRRASALRWASVVLLALAAPASAHDLEHTQVSISFARDGSFVLDVANDPNWLKLRLEPFRGSFVDRVVLWVDGREIRPYSVEFIPGSTSAIYRLRGRMPVDARTLRWYYGLVVDPYPLTIRRADGRAHTEWVGGDAWSRTIDLTGQFEMPARYVGQMLIVAGLFALGLTLRVRATSGRHSAFAFVTRAAPHQGVLATLTRISVLSRARRTLEMSLRRSSPSAISQRARTP
jgi:hypothetical protein